MSNRMAFEGTVSGRGDPSYSVKGRWTYTYEGTYYDGIFEWIVSNDGSSFTGYHEYEGNIGSFSGRRFAAGVKVWRLPPNPYDGAAEWLRSIYVLTPNDAWAVGGHFLGQPTSEPVTTHYFATQTGVTETEGGYAEYSQINMIYHWDRISWTTWPERTNFILHSVNMVDASNGWIVGADGTLLQWDGANWNLRSSPWAYTEIAPGPTLKSVCMRRDGRMGWAVTCSPTIRRDGLNVSGGRVGAFLFPDCRKAR